MKKVILIGAVLLAAITSNAQTGFGFQVGANMANVKQETTYPNLQKFESEYDSKFGFLAGFVAEVPLTASIMFRPELNFIQKGTEIDQTDTETSGGATYTEHRVGDLRMNFIELPLNFVYTSTMGAGQFFVGLGPSIGFGISGKYEGKSTTTVVFPGMPTVTDTEDANGDVKFDGEKDEDLPVDEKDLHLKSLDFGANVLVGYKFANGLFLNLGYTRGFSNLDPNQYQSLKTSGFQIKLGYMFGGGNAAE